jgi:hypothetical protein
MEIPAHHAFRGPTGGLHAPATTAPAFPSLRNKLKRTLRKAAQHKKRKKGLLPFVLFVLFHRRIPLTANRHGLGKFCPITTTGFWETMMLGICLAKHLMS